LLLLAAVAHAQVNDDAVEQMMTRRALRPEDVRLNVVSMIPRLHREHKQDTIEALINYYEKRYSTISSVVYYEMLTSIKNRTFREELKNLAVYDESSWNKLSDRQFYEDNIITYLWWYKQGCMIRSTPGYASESRIAYAEYFDFLRDLAVQEMEIPGLSSVEQWLLVYFSTPADTLFSVLNKAEYNGTALQRAWEKYSKTHGMHTAWDIGITAGAFIPSGNLNVLGVHPALGLILGGRISKITIDANISFRFLKTPNRYTVRTDQGLLSTNYYLGGYIGLDGGYELMRRKNKAVEVLAGIAYDGFDTSPGNNNNSSGNNTSNSTPSINSVSLNFGFGYRLFFREHHTIKGVSHPYMAVQAKYNILNYANPDGTDLSGNAFTIGIILGTYSTKPEKHNIIGGVKK
jgi:hypothetical protein